MEIIKELKRQERRNKIRIQIARGLEIGIKIKGTSEILKGKTIKQSGSYIKMETGRKQKKITLTIPKRKEIIEEILF